MEVLILSAIDEPLSMLSTSAFILELVMLSEFSISYVVLIIVDKLGGCLLTLSVMERSLQ